jgi:hypothetical protein
MADRSTPSGTIYHLRYLDADNNVLQKSVYIADSIRDALAEAHRAPAPTGAVKLTIAPDPSELPGKAAA